MDVPIPPPNSNPAVTFLRIKRRRDEEPLDALFVESRSRRKRTKGEPGVFQYAETVEDTVWKSEQAQREIQEKISRLARENTTKVELKAPVTQTPEHPSPLMSRQDSNAARRYTIIEADPHMPPQTQTSPPVVVSAKDLQTQSTVPDFKMYDAIPSTPAEEPELDPEMEKFQSMLNDYLKFSEVETNPRHLDTSQMNGFTMDSVMKSPGEREGDYVWDVFIHRPATLTEWNEIANVGTLSGFPAANDDYSSDSESEIEDEADEDSNAEEYYKNDYPEEEDDSSDEFHESSDYDELEHGHDDVNDFD